MTPNKDLQHAALVDHVRPGKLPFRTEMLGRSFHTAMDQPLFSRTELFILIALIVGGVLIRLVGISQPFIDAWSWRQSDNAMIANNFYLDGFRFLYPEMSYTGNEPGYVGSEFPLITFLAALLYIPFGVQEWIGRSISIAFFAASMPFFYLMVRRISNERASLLALAIYALIPLSIFASRSFMSDMPMVALSVIALYLFSVWLDHAGSLRLLVAAGVVTSLAILVKLPGVIVGLPLLYLAWAKYGFRLLLRRDIWLFAALALIPPLLWYYHSYHVSRTMGSFSASLFWEPRVLVQLESLESYRQILNRTLTFGLTPLVSAVMLAGLFLVPKKRYGGVFHWWLVALALFVIGAGNGNVRHAWYQLPVVPVAACFAGLALDAGFRKLQNVVKSKVPIMAFTAAFIVGLAFLSYQNVRPLYNSWQMPAFKAGNEIDRISPSDALVAVATDGCDPTPIYYTRRRGWHFLETGNFCWGTPEDSRQAIQNLESLRQRGVSYLVFDSYTFWWLDFYHELRQHLDSRYPRVRQTDDYIIFQLAKAEPA